MLCAAVATKREDEARVLAVGLVEGRRGRCHGRGRLRRGLRDRHRRGRRSLGRLGCRGGRCGGGRTVSVAIAGRSCLVARAKRARRRYDDDGRFRHGDAEAHAPMR